MKERPMIFNAEMVRAILDGRKTQTRRLVPEWQLPKHSPDNSDDPRYNWMAEAQRDRRYGYGVFGETEEACAEELSLMAPCPFGNKRDRIWVRETFQGPLFNLDMMDSYCKDSTPFEKPEFCVYKADGVPTPEFYDADDVLHCRWRPSIHMPRWASRITLEITGVRVERLASISNESARAEGYPAERAADGGDSDPWLWFRDLWDGIYPNQSFKVNPWVWVIEFRRIEGGA